MTKLTDGSALAGRIETVQADAARFTIAVDETLRYMRALLAGSANCAGNSATGCGNQVISGLAARPDIGLSEGDIQLLEGAMINQGQMLEAFLAELRDLRDDLRRRRTAQSELLRATEECAAEAADFGNALSLLVGCAAGEGFITREELGMSGLLRDGPGGRAVGLTPDELADWFTSRLNRLWAVTHKLQQAISTETGRTSLATALGRYTL